MNHRWRGLRIYRPNRLAQPARGEFLLKLWFHKGQGHQWDRGSQGPPRQTKP